MLSVIEILVGVSSNNKKNGFIWKVTAVVMWSGEVGLVHFLCVLEIRIESSWLFFILWSVAREREREREMREVCFVWWVNFGSEYWHVLCWARLYLTTCEGNQPLFSRFRFSLSVGSVLYFFFQTNIYKINLFILFITRCVLFADRK